MNTKDLIEEFRQTLDEEMKEFFEHHPAIALYKFRLWAYEQKLENGNRFIDNPVNA